MSLPLQCMAGARSPPRGDRWLRRGVVSTRTKPSPCGVGELGTSTYIGGARYVWFSSHPSHLIINLGLVDS